MTFKDQERKTDGKFGRSRVGGGGAAYLADNPAPAQPTLDKAGAAKVVRGLMDREGVADISLTHNKLDLDVLIVQCTVRLDDPDITFRETPNARQGDIRHPADAARLIKAQHKSRGGSLEAVAEAWYKKNVSDSAFPYIAIATPSEEDAARIAELNTPEARERLIAAAADNGVRLGFGRLGEDGYELSDEPWVTAQASTDDMERAYRAAIRKHLS